MAVADAASRCARWGELQGVPAYVRPAGVRTPWPAQSNRRAGEG